MNQPWPRCPIRKRDNSVCGSAVPADNDGEPLSACAGHLRVRATELVQKTLKERAGLDIEALTARLIESADLDSLETPELALLLAHLSQKHVSTELSSAIVTSPGLAGHAA